MVKHVEFTAEGDGFYIGKHGSAADCVKSPAQEQKK